MSFLIVVFFSMLWCSTLATLYIRPCEQHSRTICRVHQLSIIPCNSDTKCFVKMGRNVSIAIDFTPYFNAQNLKTGLFWNIGANEWPLKLLKSDDACTFTTCPMEAGKIQKFTYNTTSSYLIKVLPRSTYRIRWKIWNKENNTQVCCFQTNLFKKRHRLELHQKYVYKKQTKYF